MQYPGVCARYLSSASCPHGCVTDEAKRACAALYKRRKRAAGCVAVSVLAFQQGKVIMTGARSLAQLEDTYVFVLGVFRDGYAEFAG